MEKNGLDDDEKQVVIFKLGEEEFGVNINEVREINRMEDITKIPNTDSYIKGVINLRGGIIVVIDLAMKLSLPTKAYDNNTRIIIIEVGDNTIGMVVDSATEVLRLTADQIKEAPSVITRKIDAGYIDGVGIIGERLLILLDLAKVLRSSDIKKLQGIQQNTSGKISTDKKNESGSDQAKSDASVPSEPPDAQKLSGSIDKPEVSKSSDDDSFASSKVSKVPKSSKKPKKKAKKI